MLFKHKSKKEEAPEAEQPAASASAPEEPAIAAEPNFETHDASYIPALTLEPKETGLFEADEQEEPEKPLAEPVSPSLEFEEEDSSSAPAAPVSFSAPAEPEQPFVPVLPSVPVTPAAPAAPVSPVNLTKDAGSVPPPPPPPPAGGPSGPDVPPVGPAGTPPPPEFPDRKKRLKAWKKDARKKAREFNKTMRHTKDKAGKKALKNQLKADVKAWKRSLRGKSKEEKQDQKKAYKAFKKRRKMLQRWISSILVIAMLAALVWFGYPSVSMFARMYMTQRYTNRGDAVERARSAGTELSREICDEGFVLLRNEDNVLPLAAGTKVSVFGDDAYHFVYGGSGSAGADQSGAQSFFDAMQEYGIEYNPEVDAAYRGSGENAGGADGSIKAMVLNFITGKGSIDNDWTMLSEDLIRSAAKYSDTALIVLSSQEVEGSELNLADLQPMKGGSNRAQMIMKVCEAFEHVVFIINSGNCMELGFMNSFDSADAALWVGSPGSEGCGEIMRVLLGEVNPSGHTVDTWPVSIENEPAYLSYGDNSYTNVNCLHVLEYNEGIYVGYRYYETWFGNSETAYRNNVVYPFGYGLSYTTFEQQLVKVDADDEMITARVKVTNTGSVAGKDAVELYFMPPWNANDGLEKSVIELGAFAKTEVLQPGESQVILLSFDLRDMSSYSTAEQCYLLSAGEYRIAVGSDVHAAATSTDYKTVKIEEDIRYTTDDSTGKQITNLFDFASGESENVIYMTRASKDDNLYVPDKYTASETFRTQLAEYEIYGSAYAKEMKSEPTYGAENEIKLSALKGLAYDDAKWDSFLDQFTIDELIKLMANGGWHSSEIKRLGIPGTTMLDGPSGINSMMTKLDAVSYPMETVISSTWNVDIASSYGTVIGDEARAYGVDCWYAPAMNIHRTSIGGRNNEYYSEDPLLSGKMAAATIQAVQARGIVAVMKHFVCNDLELNARNNVTIWVNEQALREIYLRPFELAVKEGGAAGAMSSFTRLGSEWCGGSSALLKDLLREEWGFTGFVTTDAVLGKWMNAEVAAKNGNDLMLEMGLQASYSKLKTAYANDPVGVSWSLRDCAHNVCYTIVNNLM